MRMRRAQTSANTTRNAGMEGGVTVGRGRQGLVPGDRETDMQDHTGILRGREGMRQ
jgi:hypothetical protein